MPINPNIALGVQPMQIQMPDPNANMNALARALQIKGAMAEGDLNAMRLDGLRRDTDRKNKMYSLLEQDYASPEEREGALLKGGYITEAGTLAKNRQDAAKAKADAEAKQVETAHKRYELAGQAMGWLRQNPTLENAQAALQYLVTTGGMPKDHADQAMARLQSNPAGVAQFADMVFRTALSAKDQLPTIQTRNTGGSTDTIAVDPVTQQARVVNSVQNTQSPDSVASVAEQRRAHNMADSRAREANANGRVPAGYRQKADGTLEFIPGGPADPNAAKRAAPTEFQGKAGMFGARAAEADRIITDLQGKYSPAGISSKQAVGRTPLIGGALEAGANLVLSPESQKAEQAQRDFINAVLRLESGAAIAESEFANAQKQYFPQPGDSPQVIAQKAQNRKTAIQGLANNARPGAVERTGGATGSFDVSPDIDALVRKYGGK